MAHSLEAVLLLKRVEGLVEGADRTSASTGPMAIRGSSTPTGMRRPSSPRNWTACADCDRGGSDRDQLERLSTLIAQTGRRWRHP